MHEFGGVWTDTKLEAVASYFTAYAKVLKNQKFRKIYIDAFAGSGSRADPADQSLENDMFFGTEDQPEYAQMKLGSAAIALQIEPPFDEYLFVEHRRSFAEQLEALKLAHPKRRIRIVVNDANVALSDIARETKWNQYPFPRAAVFIDPYGMQVDWATMADLASTKAMDIALLFPTGPLNRMLTRSGEIPSAWEARITRVLGVRDWKESFYNRVEADDLFGERMLNIHKTANSEGLQQFYIDRLRTVFPWVLEKGLPLRNSKGSVMYHLVFVCANPAEVAGSKFLSIARSVVTSS